MTTEEIREAAKVMEAYANGKKIQYLNDDNEWIDTPKPFFDWHSYVYRIKPGLKYRPFETKEECWNEMLKHQPFGWVKDEYKYVHIVCVHKNEIEFSPDEDNDGNLFTSTMDFTSVCEKGGYTFADGTPFGKKEEE